MNTMIQLIDRIYAVEEKGLLLSKLRKSYNLS
jgi:hypothetical protein